MLRKLCEYKGIQDVEENILHTLAVQRVREVVDALPEEDAALLRALYLQTPPLTLRAYSEKTGIPVMTPMSVS